MANYSWKFARARVLSQGTCENSTFRGYLAKDPGDGAPQVESNGIIAVTLQKMLVQTDGPRILLFPAFLRRIDVDLKLHVPGHYPTSRAPAELRVVTRGGDVVFIDVQPTSRMHDVVVLPLQGPMSTYQKSSEHLSIKHDDMAANCSFTRGLEYSGGDLLPTPAPVQNPAQCCQLCSEHNVSPSHFS